MPAIDGLTPDMIQNLLIGLVVFLLIQPLVLLLAARLIDLPAATYGRSLLAAILQLLVGALAWLALSQGAALVSQGMLGMTAEMTGRVFAFVIHLAGLLLFWWITAQVFRGTAAQGFAVLLTTAGMILLLAWVVGFVVSLIDPMLLPNCGMCGMSQPPPVAPAPPL